jgi:hypothetical protein
MATNGMTIPVSGSAANAPTGVASADVARILLDSTVLIDVLRGRPTGERLRALPAKVTHRGHQFAERGTPSGPTNLRMRPPDHSDDPDTT